MTHLKQAKDGFTLMELLVVMAIVAILMSITLSVSSGVSRQNSLAQAKAELGQIQQEIELYKADKGSFPPGEDDTLGREFFLWFEEKYGDGNGIFDGDDRMYDTVDMTPYLSDNSMNPSEMRLVDPWGTAYYYEYDPANPFIYNLGSAGPDGDWDSDEEAEKDNISTRKGL